MKGEHRILRHWSENVLLNYYQELNSIYRLKVHSMMAACGIRNNECPFILLTYRFALMSYTYMSTRIPIIYTCSKS